MSELTKPPRVELAQHIYHALRLAREQMTDYLLKGTLKKKSYQLTRAAVELLGRLHAPESSNSIVIDVS
jgi:hypothetical protein